MNEINLLLLKNDINITFNNDNNGEQTQQTNETNKLMTENNYYNNLCGLFEDFGYLDTLHTFYSNLRNYHYLPLMMAIIAYNQLTNGYYLDKGPIVKRSKSDDFDLFYFTYGVYILLYQMGKKNLVLFIGLISKLLRGNMMNLYSLTKESFTSATKGNQEGFKMSGILQIFLQELAGNCGIDLNLFEVNFNSYLMFRDVSN